MEKEGEECLRESIMNGFDENIVIEILVRLPMKNQFQCKLVCKQWFGLISSPLFAKRVLATKLPSSMPWFLIYDIVLSYEIDNCDLDIDWKLDGFHTASDHNSDEPIIPQLTFNLRSEYQQVAVNAAHNGLILRHTYEDYGSGKRWIVCNPLTRKRVSIPDPGISPELVGFTVGFNNGRSQFKVVMVASHKNAEFTDEYFNFKVFCSEVGEWRDTGVSFPLVDHLKYDDSVQSVGVVYDGKLVWRMSDMLVVFDPDKNECRTFSNVPVNVRFEQGIIGTSCGRLCYASYAGGKDEEEKKSLCVSVLENYEEEEWRQLLMTQINSIVDTNEILVNYGGFIMMPLAFHPFDMDIVYFELSNFGNNNTSLVSFNLQTNKVISITGQQIPNYAYVCMPASVFVLPPLPTSVPELTYD